jgi:hypothetical protein
MPNDLDLQGLRVAVTGGTSGLGAGLVRLPERSGRLPMRRAPAELSATSGARKTSTRSRYRRPAISADSIRSSTTHQPSDPRHSRCSPTQNASNWSRR